MPSSQEIAFACARFADDVKAENIVILDVRKISSITDYFVICSATSEPHLKAIRRDIMEGVRESLNEKPAYAEGDPASHWLVVDYIDVMVHIFHEETRNFYALEDLWKDAPRVDPAAPPPVEPTPAAPAAKKATTTKKKRAVASGPARKAAATKKAPAKKAAAKKAPAKKAAAKKVPRR